jgi:3-hydroxyisobutyrate dehydrogenase
MATIGFIGLGNMGLPMARNLLKAGHSVRAFDVSAAALTAAEAAGAACVTSPSACAEGCEYVVTALPAAAQVREVYSGEKGLFSQAVRGTTFIDCSTIDVETARAVETEAEVAAMHYVDSPMSGGVGGAEAGTLTFMVGGTDAAFASARPILEAMGKNIFHAGGPGAGAAAKICNNMMLAIQMIGVAEGFNLAERLGLEAHKLYEISSTATARCWSLNDYCPAPGPAPSAPSNRDYAPGFAAALMLKDLRIAMEAARGVEAVTPMGAQAAQIYAMMNAAGQGGLDFSGVIRFLEGKR